MSAVHVVIATRNPHKVQELRQLLRLPEVRWQALAQLTDAPAVAETGRSFTANAIRKAIAAARATGHLALADDSGIEVKALRWGPGIRSARFAGRHGNDHANNQKLLHRLVDVPESQRQARYRCALALADSRRVIAVTHGTWTGRIARQPAGRAGFGYDPLFVVPGLGKTVAQLPMRVKQQLSHRAQAARRMRPILQRILRGD